MICTTGKVAYPSRGAAYEAARASDRRRHQKRGSSTLYECRRCRQWHLTHGAYHRAPSAVLHQIRG